MKSFNKASLEITQLRAFIKELLAKRKLTYEDAANHLKISLATFKRMMTTTDFSFEQLLQLSDWFNLSIEDFLAFAKKRKRDQVYYTSEQEDLFVRNPLAAYCFVQIVVGKSTESILSDMNLNSREFEQILFSLDRANLIELLPSGKFRIKDRGPYRWESNGALEKAYFKRFLNTIVAELTENSTGFERLSDGKSKLVMPFEVYLDADSQYEFCKELEEFLKAFSTRSRALVRIKDSSELKPVCGVMLVGPVNAWRRVLVNSK